MQLTVRARGVRVGPFPDKIQRIANNNMPRTERFFPPISREIAEPAFEIDMGSAEVCGPASVTFFAPMHYEPGYSYPLIVWLHGTGGDERHLMRMMPLVSMRNYVAVAPRATQPVDATNPQLGYRWLQTEEHIQAAEQFVFDGLAGVRQKFNVASDRIFLAGFDTGGTMAFRLALNHPEVFAGVLSICGAFPQGFAPFRNLPKARQLPVFMAIGRDSSEYPPDRAGQDLRLLHSAGMVVTLRQYPFGHELAPQMLADLDRWIIEQITRK